MRIILCGFGAVGQSLASLFESRAKELYEMHGLRPRIVGVFDSKGAALRLVSFHVTFSLCIR